MRRRRAPAIHHRRSRVALALALVVGGGGGGCGCGYGYGYGYGDIEDRANRRLSSGCQRTDLHVFLKDLKEVRPK